MMGFNVTWLTTQEESLVDGNLLSVGRRNAEERIAALLILLYKRAAALQGAAAAGGGVPFPLTQQHMADGRLHLLDGRALVRLADLYGDGRPPKRPLG